MGLGRFRAYADLLFARGVSASRVQISHPHPSLSRDRVLGRFLAVHGCAFCYVRDAQIRRQAGQRKTKISTVVAVSEQPEAPRLHFSSWGSHNIHNIPAWKDTMEGPRRALYAKRWRLRMGVGL